MDLYCYKSFREINKKKFKSLIEDSFKRGRKTKKLSKDYFRKTKPKYILIYKNKNDYVGAAVVLKEKRFDYLDKFIVAGSYQGLGIGNKLWAKIKRKSRSFCFRAATDNPIGRWYFKNSTGHHKESEFTVFWVRVKKRYIPEAIKYCLNKRKTLRTIKVKRGK